MNLEEYLLNRIQRTLKDGVTHIDREFKERFDDFSVITVEDLADWRHEVGRKMIEAVSYSVDHCYWWSLHDHLCDIILHAALFDDMAA